MIETLSKLLDYEPENLLNRLLSTSSSRLMKSIRFHSMVGKSKSENVTSLDGYVSRMKPSQSHIFWLAGANRDEVENSPTVEQLLAHGYEVLYIIGAADVQSTSSLPEFNGKKFRNIAKELVSSNGKGAKREAVTKQFEILTIFLEKDALNGLISKAVISESLQNSSCALAGNFCNKFLKYMKYF